MKRQLIFCTAPAAQVRAAAAVDDGASLYYAGPANSPFASEKNFLCWGNGPFTLKNAAALWGQVRLIAPERVIIPLNNRNGEGYQLHRAFARTVMDGEVLEHYPGGALKREERGALALLLRPEERWHAFAIGAFGLLRPLFGLSGGDVPRPAPAVPLECRALRDEAAGAPDVSVVIRTWNEAAHLGRTLGMVFGQEGFAGEVIVIDSGSTDATCAIALAHPVRLFGIPKKAFSYGAALNLGARLARGSIVVNLSAHAIPAHRRWLRELTAPLADASIAGVYGRELPIEGWNGHFEAKLLADAFGPLPHRTTANPFFSNANAAMRRQDLLDHPFDEHAGWGEDALWAHAMQAKGMGIAYQPQAAVHHSHNTSMRENFVRCLKHHRTLFAGYLKGREREACAGFYRTLPGRAASFRRFLTADRGMGPLAALLYAPWCEYVNWLGCRIAAEEAREGKR